jgi:hypothetical protein
MEVMFALAVGVIGLLSLSPLLHIALRYAVSSLRMNETTQSGVSAAAMARASAVADFGRLVVQCDDELDPASVGSYYYDPMSGTPIPGKKRLLSHARVNDLSTPPNSEARLFGNALAVGEVQVPPRPDTGAIDSPGYRRVNTSGWRIVDRFAGFCIDPLGMTYVENSSPTAYRGGVFPYYKPHWNLLDDPSLPHASSSSPVGLLPRMWRCSVAREGAPASEVNVDRPNALVSEVLDRRTAEQLFYLRNNPSQQVIGKKTLTRSFQTLEPLVKNPGIPDFRTSAVTGDSDSRYSWFATLTPGLVVSSMYTLSTVVVENRELVELPVAPVPEPKENLPRGERVGWVSDYSGFDGGSGGEIKIVLSNAVHDEVKAGQWLMLSRQEWNVDTSSGDNDKYVLTGVSQTAPTYHSWYRIISVSDVSQENYAGGTGWSRTLLLDGPDWVFTRGGLIRPTGMRRLGLITGTNDLRDDTLVTLIDGAVEVIQTNLFMD